MQTWPMILDIAFIVLFGLPVCINPFFPPSRLMKYCTEHQKTDVLVTGISLSENPFKENKACTVL